MNKFIRKELRLINLFIHRYLLEIGRKDYKNQATSSSARTSGRK